MTDESLQSRIAKLADFCRTRRAGMLREQAQTDCQYSPQTDTTVREALVTLLDVGGVDLAQELLSEHYPFDSIELAVARLSKIERWCESHAREAEPAPQTPLPEGRFEVFDTESHKRLMFDTTGTEHWGPANDTEGFDPIEAIPIWHIESHLYRHARRCWTLVSQTTHWEADIPSDKEARRLSDREAVEWLMFHGFDLPADVVDLAEDLAFRPGPPVERESPDETGVESNEIPADTKPIWNKDRGELSLGGRIVRRIPRPGVAKNIVRVLDCFQEDGWPDRIDDPLDFSKNQQRLHETIKRLNDNLEQIRFRADGTGQGIVWRRIQRPEDRPDTAPEGSDMPF